MGKFEDRMLDGLERALDHWERASASTENLCLYLSHLLLRYGPFEYAVVSAMDSPPATGLVALAAGVVAARVYPAMPLPGEGQAPQDNPS